MREKGGIVQEGTFGRKAGSSVLEGGGVQVAQSPVQSPPGDQLAKGNVQQSAPAQGSPVQNSPTQNSPVQSSPATKSSGPASRYGVIPKNLGQMKAVPATATAPSPAAPQMTRVSGFGFDRSGDPQAASQ